MKPRHAAIVLDACASRRMGRPKQLIQINGTNLIRRTVLVAVATTPSRVLVVVGAHADDVFAAVADLAVEGVDCAEWEEGMAASLRAGFNALCDAEEGAVAALRSAWSRRVASAGPSNRVAFESDERMCKCLWRHGRSPHAAAACLASGCAGIAWRLWRARSVARTDRRSHRNRRAIVGARSGHACGPRLKSPVKKGVCRHRLQW
jgi:hypothetical protein